jgi:hypothetical protein
MGGEYAGEQDERWPWWFGDTLYCVFVFGKAVDFVVVMGIKGLAIRPSCLPFQCKSAYIYHIYPL